MNEILDSKGFPIKLIIPWLEKFQEKIVQQSILEIYVHFLQKCINQKQYCSSDYERNIRPDGLHTVLKIQFNQNDAAENKNHNLMFFNH